jgi:hypothetical protein
VSTLSDLTPVTAAPPWKRFIRIVKAEIRLMAKGQGWLWYAGALGLNIACLLAPLEAVQHYVLPVVWLWPITTWSQMGNRERRHGTAQMVFAVPRPALRQLPALWAAGILFTLAASAGGWLRLAIVGEFAATGAWLIGTLFVPALALALGAWTGSSRAFELFYLLLWYVGRLEGVPAFAYAGTTAGSVTPVVHLAYLGLSAALLVLAVLGRWRQARPGSLIHQRGASS